MRRHGFTTIELLLVIVIMGILGALVFPRASRALEQVNVRSTKAYVGTAVATARASAAQRGCRSVLHFTSGVTGTMWVTACPRLTPGVGTVDTIGLVEPLATRYKVTLTPTRDSIQYDPRGLSLDNQVTIVRIVGAAASTTDSVQVNVLGKMVRQ